MLGRRDVTDSVAVFVAKLHNILLRCGSSKQTGISGEDAVVPKALKH